MDSHESGGRLQGIEGHCGAIVQGCVVPCQRLVYVFSLSFSLKLLFPMRLFVLLFSILAFSSCARIAEVKEFRPVFLPAPGLAASFPSPAASFAKATKLEKKSRCSPVSCISGVCRTWPPSSA